MNRRMTFLVGGIVALVLFAMMVVAIRDTDPWTVDASELATQADDASAQFQGAMVATTDGQTVDGAALKQRADDLSKASHAVADASATWGTSDELMAARQQFVGTVGAYDQEVARATFDELNEAQLGTLASVMAALADDARLLDAAVVANLDAANDQASVVDTLFGPQVLAFEVLGILLTAVMIGALVIARPIDAADDDTHYSHPTPAQVAESDHASDPAAHALRNPAPATKEAQP